MNETPEKQTGDLRDEAYQYLAKVREELNDVGCYCINCEDYEIVAAKFFMLADSCRLFADKIHEQLQERKRDAKLYEEVKKAKDCFPVSEQDAASLWKFVSELKAFKDSIKEEYDKGDEDEEKEIYVSRIALVFALRQLVARRMPTDLVLEYEKADYGYVRLVFFVDKFIDARLNWNCDVSEIRNETILEIYLAHDDGTRSVLATFKTFQATDDAFRKMNALGVEYALAFQNLAEELAQS